MRKEDELNFGDYVEIEQKRYQAKNEIYLHKVINTSVCNSWVDVPVQSPAAEVLHGESVPVVRCICCGICEDEVLAYRIQDVRKASKPDSPDFNYDTSKYLRFEELVPNSKTKRFAVLNKTSASVLGYVKWYAPWRRYCFFIDSSVFDAGCLADIHAFINSLMLERKEKED